MLQAETSSPDCRNGKGEEGRGGEKSIGGHSGLMTNADLSGRGASGASRPLWSEAPFNTITIAEENRVMIGNINANSGCDYSR